MTDLLDHWLQDDFAMPWISRQPASYSNGPKACITAVLADGRSVMALAIRGDTGGACGIKVPDRAIAAMNDWSGFQCGMPAGHDCPHVAIVAATQWTYESLMVYGKKSQVNA